MKTNKIIKIASKSAIHVITIVAVFIIILQTKPNIEEVQIISEETTQEQKVAENTIEQRHSIITNRKAENLRQKENYEESTQEQCTRIEDITISKDMDLTIRTGISKEDFKILISKVKYDTSKFFYENSDMIYDLCQEYQINEIFFCGLISAESGWNIANNHRRTHNYISLMTKNGLIHYNTVEEGLEAAAKALHNNYLTEGGRFYNGKTLYGVKTRFCPASSTWVDLVYGRMQQITNCI